MVLPLATLARSACLVLAAEFAPLSALAQSSLTLWYPKQPAQCSWSRIWVAGGQGPFRLTATPPNLTSTILIDFGTFADTSRNFSWLVNLKAGSLFQLVLSDYYSQYAYSPALTVNYGSNTSCLSAPLEFVPNVIPAPPRSKKMAIGAIVGAAIAGLIVIALAVGIFVHWKRRNRPNRKSLDSSTTPALDLAADDPLPSPSPFDLSVYPAHEPGWSYPVTLGAFDRLEQEHLLAQPPPPTGTSANTTRGPAEAGPSTSRAAQQASAMGPASVALPMLTKRQARELARRQAREPPRGQATPTEIVVERDAGRLQANPRVIPPLYNAEWAQQWVEGRC